MVVACMARDSIHHGLRTKCYDLYHTNLVVIKLLKAYGSKRRVKVFMLALFLVSIPWFRYTMRRDYYTIHNQENNVVESRNVGSNKLKIFPLLFRNLTKDGLIGLHDKGLIVDNDDENEKLVNYYSSCILDNNKMDVIPYLDLERKQLDLDRNYDFAFTHEGIDLIDKVLRVDGILFVQNKGNLRVSELFKKPLNYEIVYQKQFEQPRLNVTIIGMKKTRMVSDDKNTDVGNTVPHRRLMFEQKKAEALKNLENVLLEPPRTTSGRSKTYSKKTRYLPDLMEDSLEDYPRRVFIDVNGDTGWFTKNYPTRNKIFEIYQVETTMPTLNNIVNNDEPEEDPLTETEITEWLRENVKKGEYVVMKAEADVVEELVNNKAIELVDELFLECRYQGMKCNKCRRPYWKCLALYGLLKDAGVAVHQWWG